MKAKYSKTFWMGLSVTGFSIVFLIGSLVFQSGRLQQAQKNLTELSSRVLQQKESLETEKQEAKKQVNGFDQERSLRDLAILEEFFRDVFCWQNAQEFEQAKDKALDKWKIPADSDFITHLMGENPSFMGQDGSVTSEIETESLNMTFNDMDLFVSDLADGLYTYSGLVDFCYQDPNGTQEKGSVLVRAAVSEDGTIASIEAWPTVK